MTKLALITAGALALNVPFGYWRSGARRFGPVWILCVHAPVPLIIAARLLLGIDYTAIPLLIAASVTGQFTGGRLRRVSPTAPK